MNSEPSPDLFEPRPQANWWDGTDPERVNFLRARVGGGDGPVKTFRAASPGHWRTSSLPGLSALRAINGRGRD